MNAKIPYKLWQLARTRLESFNVSGRDLQWKEWVDIDLSQLTAKRLDELESIAAPHTKIRGVGTLVRDIRAWRRVVAGDKGVKPRSVEQFTEMVTRLLARVPGHRVYVKHGETGAWLAYYVTEIVYHPPTPTRDDRHTPPVCVVRMCWHQRGHRQSKAVHFTAEECLGMTPTEALLGMGYHPETKDLRADYLAHLARYDALHDKVGLQVYGRGVALDDLDGNDGGDRWSRWSRGHVKLDHTGDAARMVIDVFRETDERDTERDGYMNSWFWQSEKRRGIALPDDETEIDGEDNDDDASSRDRRKLTEEDAAEERPQIEVPIHPFLACFDMKRHLRLSVHVADVTEYAYDRTLSEKLVLPPDTRALVEMLVTHRGAFVDIVAGKGGGAVVLCAGPPGVGKTLTAEVYAETLARPLYSVQCSQLGTDPDELEKQLTRVFARAMRWNAILLLDEADVYIAARGSDLAQNAIVGVFLRVLEYYAGVLFMTTNRADAVDDAIASRCVARLDYAVPSPADQRRIWEILAATAGVRLAPKVVSEIVARHPHLSGRDVKNLLKLALMVSAARGEPITADTIDFVKRFKPTADAIDALAAPAPFVQTAGRGLRQ